MTSSKREFDDTIAELHLKYDELLIQPSAKISEISQSTTGSGIYLFTDPNDNDSYVYVGRASSFGKRLKNHIRNNHNQASFAFKVARKKTGIQPTYQKKGSRQDLLDNNPKFRREFEDAIKWIKTLDVRRIEEPDPIRQALLEILVAVRTGATYNDFHTS